MNNYPSEITMRQASIFELRTMARNMGVNSPTTYKKDELINKMLKILSGDESPEIPKSRAGRPPKQIISSNLTGSFNIFEQNKSGCQNLDKYNFSSPKKSEISILACPTSNLECEPINASFNFESREGYLQTLEDGNSFIFESGNVASVDNIVNIAPQKVRELCLRNGDLVKVLCKKDEVSGNRFFAELEEFEQQNIKDVYKLEDRNCFNKMQVATKINTKAVFDNVNKCALLFADIKDTICGSRNIIMCKNLRGYKDFVLTFKQQNKAYNIVNICLEVLPEEEVFVKNGPNFELFHTYYGDYEKQNNHVITLAIERIKRLAEQGKDVVVLVNEIGKLIKYKNFSYGFDARDFKYKSFDNVSKILSLARTFEGGNNITVFAFLKEDNNNSNFSQILTELDNLNCNFIKC